MVLTMQQALAMVQCGVCGALLREGKCVASCPCPRAPAKQKREEQQPTADDAAKSAESAATACRRLPKGEGRRSGAENIVWSPKRMADGSVRSVPRIRGACRLKNNSNSMLEIDRRKLRASFQASLAASDDPAHQLELSFRIMLLDRGDHVGSLNHLHKCRNDGNVYNYARALRRFLESGVLKRARDFTPSNRNRAVAFARGYAQRIAPMRKVRGRAWSALSEKQRDKLTQKIFLDQMHGFDDFCELRVTEANVASPPWTPSAAWSGASCE